MSGEKIWKVNVKDPKKTSGNWLEKVLATNRGLTNSKKLADFLNPSINQIINIKLSDLTKGVSRVERAIKNREKIIVYSDYDADGICATAIMWETLNDLGANVMPYVPHRIKEGYGLFIPAIEQLAKEGVSLIITVDHGVTAIKQTEAANKLGIDVIVTDHHVLPNNLPKSHALVHTTELCGAGVSWLFSYHLISKIKPSYKNQILEKLELAAIATIADLVPLNPASRSIVKYGLKQLKNTKRPGMISLIKQSGISSDIGTYEIGHIIAPRINAMGRIEHGLDSLRLICAKNKRQADRLASLLAQTNTKRQDLTTGAIESALLLVKEYHLIGVVSHESWHEGVIGLVASRLVEKHNKPMIVISRGETYSKGSARSIPGFNIINAIRSSSELLLDAGGHPMAAGFTIETRHIESFTKKINVYAQTNLNPDLLNPVIKIDCTLEPQEINFETLKIIKKFEPYGVSNPEPTFTTKNTTVEDIQTVGGVGQHLKLLITGKVALWFNHGVESKELRPGYKIDLAFTINENHYNGNTSIQLKIIDLKINN